MKFTMQNLVFLFIILFCLVGSGVTWFTGDHKVAESLFSVGIGIAIVVTLFPGWDE